MAPLPPTVSATRAVHANLDHAACAPLAPRTGPGAYCGATTPGVDRPGYRPARHALHARLSVTTRTPVRRNRPSARTCRRWYSQLPTDLTRQSIVDLAMARHH